MSTPNRYLYKSIDPYSSHAQILAWVKQEKPEKVLEVGTATGYLSSEMAKSGCAVTGIELDPEMAKIARDHCVEMFVGDIESIDIRKLGGYDAIICADVLEHLRNPGDILRKLCRQLNPGGNILISLPNVAHVWVRLNLLLGRFEYSQSGILDETHLHFYTLASSKKLVTDSGLEIISISSTPAPLPLIFPITGMGRLLHFLHIVNWGLAKANRTLFGYQFIIACRPRSSN